MIFYPKQGKVQVVKTVRLHLFASTGSGIKRVGIPVYFARGNRRPDASGRALIAVLPCAEERLSAKRFAEYLSLAQVPDLIEEGGPPAARDSPEDLVNLPDPNLDAEIAEDLRAALDQFVQIAAEFVAESAAL